MTLNLAGSTARRGDLQHQKGEFHVQLGKGLITAVLWYAFSCSLQVSLLIDPYRTETRKLTVVIKPSLQDCGDIRKKISWHFS